MTFRTFHFVASRYTGFSIWGDSPRWGLLAKIRSPSEAFIILSVVAFSNVAAYKFLLLSGGLIGEVFWRFSKPREIGSSMALST